MITGRSKMITGRSKMITSVLSGPTTCSGLFGGSWALVSVLSGSKSAVGALQERSKRVQEASERLSRGFSRASASKMRSGTNFGPVLEWFWEAPGPQN